MTENKTNWKETLAGVALVVAATVGVLNGANMQVDRHIVEAKLDLPPAQAVKYEKKATELDEIYKNTRFLGAAMKIDKETILKCIKDGGEPISNGARATKHKIDCDMSLENGAMAAKAQAEFKNAVDTNYGISSPRDLPGL